MKQNVRPWKLLSSTPALQEKWFPVRRDTVELPSGKIVDDYFVWEAPRIVKVIPVTSEGLFVLCKQYRHAIGEIMLQFPAGGLDKGETLEQGARRELKEETGYVADELIHLGTLAPYATKMTGLVDVFIALDAISEGDPVYDEQEETEVCLMTEKEIWGVLDEKKPHMVDLPAALALAKHYLQKD